MCWVAAIRHITGHAPHESRAPSGGPVVRAAAEQAVTRARSVVLDMAYFTAREDKPLITAGEQVRRADVYAGIIGVPGRPPVRDEPGLSYAELEFAAAGELGLPRLVFVLDENAVLQLPQVFLSDPEFGGAGRFRVPWCVSVLVPLLLVYSRSRAVVFPTSATLLVKGLRSERGGSTQRVHRRRQQGEPVENAARSAPHAGLRSAAGVRVLCGPCRRRGLLPGCGHGVAR